MDDAVSNPESAAPVSAQDVEGQLEGDGAAFHKEQPLYNLAWDELNYTIEQGGGKGQQEWYGRTARWRSIAAISLSNA